MLNKWHDRYEQLKDYVAQNPEVELGQEVIAIPQEYRPEFYRRFDLARSAFVEEKFPELVERAKPLCQSYLQAEEEIKKNPSLFEIKLPSHVRWFADNPVNGLQRVLYDSLFNLLRGKISIEQFTNNGCKSIRSQNDYLTARCYQCWLVISLTNLLKPETFYRIDLSVGTSSVASVQSALHDVKPVKEPEETSKISLEHPSHDIFIVPDILTHSRRINRWVALRAEPTTATWTADNASENLEWIHIGQEELTPDLVLVNTSDKLEDLAMFRDDERTARPELALVSRESDNWYEKREDWQELQFIRGTLNPKQGMYVVSRPDVPEDVSKKLDFENVLNKLSEQENKEDTSGIQVISTGLDTSRLEQYVDMLASQD